jgi:hypothetical protein
MTQAPDSNAAALHATPYGTLPPASPMPSRKPISLPRILEMRTRGEKITMITAYDATFAAVADAAGIDAILVGDSLGMVCQGLHTTVGVSLEHMRYHTEMVARGLRRAQGTAWLIGDLPFGAYQESKEQAIRSAVNHHAGRCPHGEAGRRWLDHRNRALPCRARHSGVRPFGADAANGSLARRLPRARQNPDQR